MNLMVYSESSGELDLNTFPSPSFHSGFPSPAFQPKSPNLGKVPGAGSGWASLERQLRVMRKTHLTAHTASSTSAWPLSLGERLKSTFFKILALARNASQADMSARLYPDRRTTVLSLLTFWDDKTQPLPLHAEDGSQNWCNFKPSLSPTVLDFYHNSKILHIPFLPVRVGHPPSQNRIWFRTSRIRCPRGPLVWTLGSAESHPFLSTI